LRTCELEEHTRRKLEELEAGERGAKSKENSHSCSQALKR